MFNNSLQILLASAKDGRSPNHFSLVLQGPRPPQDAWESSWANRQAENLNGHRVVRLAKKPSRINQRRQIWRNESSGSLELSIVAGKARVAATESKESKNWTNHHHLNWPAEIARIICRQPSGMWRRDRACLESFSWPILLSANFAGSRGILKDGFVTP
ncbi:hypothetical protein BT63DRAFT_437868 [Microthyrium microscopicum]|uniref:Uncharacterized protein n=1 Tax=Microthyrium microscopicum TaxID=703497 RepID=A0A6A6UKH0_9PEZI|nr:hypothetical protein BT63DRAFT_437868 [Microthyrium microscopicum]